MSSQLQTIAALVVVALAAIWLIARTLAKRRHPGCSSDCGCPSSDLKGKVGRAGRKDPLASKLSGGE